MWDIDRYAGKADLGNLPVYMDYTYVCMFACSPKHIFFIHIIVGFTVGFG